jgi:hypothetical protein
LAAEVATTIYLALRLAQPALLLHQGIVVGEEGAEFLGPAGEGKEHVRHEAGFLLHIQDAAADILRQVLQLRDRIAAYGIGAHGAMLGPQVRSVPVVPSATRP